MSRPINVVWACCITVNRYTTKGGIRYFAHTIHVLAALPVYTSGQLSEQCLQVCGGIRSKHLTSTDLAEVPPESIPNGEFKVCLPPGLDCLYRYIISACDDVLNCSTYAWDTACT